MFYKYADFHTAAIETNLSIEIYQENDNQTFLGKWEFGQRPTSEPRFLVVESDDPRVKADCAAANVLMATMPATCFDVFVAARANNVFVLKKAQDLAARGYRSEALTEKMTPLVAQQAKELNLLASQLWLVQIAIDSSIKVNQETFPDTGETAAESTAFNLAIVQNMKPLTEADLATLKNGDLPERLNDARLVQALARTPSCLHTIDRDSLAKIKELYGKLAFPNTTAALEALSMMVEAAKTAIASAVVSLERLSNAKDGDVFAMLKHGAWIEGNRNSASVYRAPRGVVVKAVDEVRGSE